MAPEVWVEEGDVVPGEGPLPVHAAGQPAPALAPLPARPRRHAPAVHPHPGHLGCKGHNYFTFHTLQPTCCLNPLNLFISVTRTGPCQQLSSSQPSTTVVSLRTNQS